MLGRSWIARQDELLQFYWHLLLEPVLTGDENYAPIKNCCRDSLEPVLTGDENYAPIKNYCRDSLEPVLTGDENYAPIKNYCRDSLEPVPTGDFSQARRRFVQIPKPPSPTMHVNVQAGMLKPMNSQSMSAHSPEPLKIKPSASASGKLSMM